MKAKRTKKPSPRYAGQIVVALEPAEDSFVEALAKAMCSTKRQVLLFAVSQLRLNPKASVLLATDTDPAAPAAQPQPEGLAA